MRKILLIIFPLLLTSCIHYADVKETMKGNVNNSVEYSKVGTACAYSVLGLVAFGDSSVETAKKMGEIKKIAVVDTSYNDFRFYLPFYQKGCTIVKGE